MTCSTALSELTSELLIRNKSPIDFLVFFFRLQLFTGVLLYGNMTESKSSPMIVRFFIASPFFIRLKTVV